MTIFRQRAIIQGVIDSEDAIGDYIGADAGQLIFYGKLVNPFTNELSFKAYGYASSITIKDIENVNLTDIDFTIIGTFDGILISETIAGPDGGGAVHTKNLFHVVNKIILSNRIDSRFQIGSNWNVMVNLNYNQTELNGNIDHHILVQSARTPKDWTDQNLLIYRNFTGRNIYNTDELGYTNINGLVDFNLGDGAEAVYLNCGFTTEFKNTVVPTMVVFLNGVIDSETLVDIVQISTRGK
jgi:hypothetical protein